MRAQNPFILEDEDEIEEVSLGLLRLSDKIHPHEFFFKINSSRKLQFERTVDLEICGEYFNYQHSVFQACDRQTRNIIRLFKNKSCLSHQKKEIDELFSDENPIHYLIPKAEEVDYIMFSSDNIADFSVLLPSQNINFSIQELITDSNHPLYKLIQYEYYEQRLKKN